MTSNMNHNKLLLCTDMDRTIIPNGVQSESEYARKYFSEFCARPEVTLAYVTGRHPALVEEAIKNYCLPVPDYAITDVGTRIFHIVDKQWNVLQAWQDEIEGDWQGCTYKELREILKGISSLQLQELSKQNTYKLSYYVPLHVDKDALSIRIQTRLQDNGIKATLVWSIDEPNGIGLLDVLPSNATKLHAIDFLRRQLGYPLEDVVFAGDSGNDLSVLVSNIPAVLVANASTEVRDAAIELSRHNNTGQALYCANGQYLQMNGNFAAGVLEGVWHFKPQLHNLLRRFAEP